jgi:hypothetical protein
VTASSERPWTFPEGLAQIHYVQSFAELAAFRFTGLINAVCWPRVLLGDFSEILTKLHPEPGITNIMDETLDSLVLSPQGEIAREWIRQDLADLRARELSPSLDTIDGYVNHADTATVPTHVQSWHVDSATAEADTWLCTYVGASSEGLCHEDAVLKVELPDVRKKLLQEFGGDDDAAFQEFLEDHYYDLHYAAVGPARTWQFGLGNLWRIACAYPDSPVLPCVHRAPPTIAAQPRLLLIS